MTFDDGQLQAYIDGELDTQSGRQLADAIENDPTLAARVAALQAERQFVGEALSVLAPQHSPDRRRAKHVLVDHRRKTLMTRKTKRIAAAVAAVLLFAVALAFQPVRAFASDVLSLFRVESFAVVDVDPERLEEIAAAVDENMYWGEAEFIEGGEGPTEVESLAAAADAVGFAPATLDGTPGTVAVMDGVHARFTPELETLQSVFTTLGLDADLLPEEMDGQPFDVMVEAGVMAQYDLPLGTVGLVQMPAPTVDVPEGVDIQELGESMLLLLGMSERDAARLANEIDFASTLVLPIPTDSLGSVQEVEVNGTSGLLFEGERWAHYDDDAPADSTVESAIVWQANGYVYMVVGEDLDGLDLLSVAELVQ